MAACYFAGVARAVVPSVAAVLATQVVVLIVACGRSTENPAEPKDERGAAGISSGGVASSGSANVAASGGEISVGGHSPEDNNAGVGNTSGTGGNSTATGGDNDGGAGGADAITRETTAGDSGTVTITYEPDSTATVVRIKLDPNCDAFAADMKPAGLICADVVLTGQTIGVSRVCFRSRSADRLAFACRVRTVRCRDREVVHEVADQIYCCEDLYPNVPAGDRTCVTTDRPFGRFAFGLALDSDQDDIPNLDDNCSRASNPVQSDKDGDGIGNSCDNCFTLPNQDQQDSDEDGIGDVCDPTPSGAGGAGGAAP